MKIDLREYYPYYRGETPVEVPDEVVEVLKTWRNKEQAQVRRRYRNNAYFSLDQGDMLDNNIVYSAYSPDELYERKLSREQLHRALAQLPDMQAKRITAYYFFGMKIIEIARAEGVGHAAVTKSIQRGMKTLKRIIQSENMS